MLFLKSFPPCVGFLPSYSFLSKNCSFFFWKASWHIQYLHSWSPLCSHWPQWVVLDFLCLRLCSVVAVAIGLLSFKIKWVLSYTVLFLILSLVILSWILSFGWLYLQFNSILKSQDKSKYSKIMWSNSTFPFLGSPGSGTARMGQVSTSSPDLPPPRLSS